MMFVPLMMLVAATVESECLDVRSVDAPITLEGILEQVTYTTPEVGAEKPETAFILLLDRPICIDDGGDFADPDQRFDRVQLYTSVDGILPRLNTAKGRRVRVGGSGFAAHTAHHHAPLVVDGGNISVVGR